MWRSMTSIIGAINAIRKIESCAIDTFLNFNWPQIDSGQYKILLKSKKKWYEVLLYHETRSKPQAFWE